MIIMNKHEDLKIVYLDIHCVIKRKVPGLNL